MPIYTNENLFIDKEKKKSSNLQPSLPFYGMIKINISAKEWPWLPFQKICTFLSCTKNVHAKCCLRKHKFGAEHLWCRVMNDVVHLKPGKLVVGNDLTDLWRDNCRYPSTRTWLKGNRSCYTYVCPYVNQSFNICPLINTIYFFFLENYSKVQDYTLKEYWMVDMGSIS